MIEMPYQRLLIWQKALALVTLTYKATGAFPKEELYGLTSQMRRASVSIPSNIAEGSQRTSSKDFAHFILITKGSLAELYTQATAARNLQFLSTEQYEALAASIQEVDKMLRSFYRKLIQPSPK